MATRRIDAEIDRLYQLPLDEFTAARNILAKNAGADAARVKQLTRPPLAAWAVNQLFWKRRPVYDALIAAATGLRQTHKTILSGKRGDLRTAGKAHDEALDDATRETLALMRDAGHPVTDATRQAIVTTLRALPADEPGGRLSRTLQPGGFEMLAGFAIGGSRVPERPAAARPVKGRESVSHREEARSRKDPKAEAASQAAAKAAREAAARAARQLREAEHTARREEFEAARAVREADRASAQLEEARQALSTAKEAFAEAEAAATAAGAARETAERRAEAAEQALEAARRRSAETQL